MIKRILLFILIPTLLFAQIADWKSKTVNQLSGMVSGTTDIGSKSYWETRAYNQIHDILDRIDRIQYASDYTSITNAVAGLSDSSGGRLFVPSGTYGITAQLATSNNYVIEGEGYKSLISLTKSSATSVKVFNVTNDTNVVISGIRILGDTTNAYASEHDHAINITDSKNIFIINCYLELVGGDGIYISEGCENIYIIGCYINLYDYGGGSGHAGTFDYGRNGIACVGGTNIIVANNYISNGYGGIDFEATSGDTIRRIIVDGNIIVNARESLIIHAGADDTYIEDVTISNNIVRDAYIRGIRLVGSGATHYGRNILNATISGNVVDSTYAGYGITVEGSGYVTVTGNTVTNTVPSAFNCSDSSRYISIIGNSFCNSDQYGLGVAQCDTFVVIGNILSTNADGQIVNSGNRGYLWMGNIGYNYFMTDYVYSCLLYTSPSPRD